MKDLTPVPQSDSQESTENDTMELTIPVNTRLSSESNTDPSMPGTDEDLEGEENDTGEVDTLIAEISINDGMLLLDEAEADAIIDSGRTIPLQPIPEETALALENQRIEKVREKTPIVQAVQRCNIGFVRMRNEDSSFMFTAETGGQEPLMPFGLYIVADGMGGHYAGHEASKNVSRLVAKHVMQRIYLPLLQNTGSSIGSQEPIQEVILDAIQSANTSIHSPDPEKDSGTTLTAALVFGRRLYIAHVGDSRAYIFENEQLRLVTTDHSYVRRLQEAGQLTEEEAASHPHRNMLYMAVGQGGQLDIDTFTQPLPKSGKLILCSDGLWGLVTEQMVKEVLSKDNVSLSMMADELVNLALKAGGYDNITVILVDFSM
jgi:protein phosphatase